MISRIFSIPDSDPGSGSRILESGVKKNTGSVSEKLVVAGTCCPYMSSLNYCNQTKYGNKQSLLWNLCVLLMYIFLLLRIVKFYANNYSGDPLRSTRSLHARARKVIPTPNLTVLPLLNVSACSNSRPHTNPSPGHVGLPLSNSNPSVIVC
jgi:hypothetical protein